MLRTAIESVIGYRQLVRARLQIFSPLGMWCFPKRFWFGSYLCCSC